ncbi:Methylsterol monooxygenase 1 [Oopsacas minuta]|uniref:Methylsterol monooxygenase 1 n=1 Tax=Oopsacas minuta TaxID=111878 RepID=A0AAV7JPS6_9METZ|nr:Methylsterol monooxygenase 1 [Oopsacas minuta]
MLRNLFSLEISENSFIMTEYSDRCYFEQSWRHMSDSYSKFTIATWGSLLAHELVYFLMCTPGFMLQFIPTMQKLKIQQDKPETLENQWKCLKFIFFSHVFIQLPMICTIFTYTEIMDISFDYETIPPWYKLCLKSFVCLLIEDSWHYFFHRFLLHGALYKQVHKIHHNFHAPFGLAAEYAHPVEIILLSGGFFLGIVLFCDHLIFMWVWMCLRLLVVVDAHTGYNHWQPLHILPFYGGAHFHDFHHRTFDGNFASTFTYLDKLFGTDRQYRNFYKELEMKE